MSEFLIGAAVFILAAVALGLLRLLRGPTDPERLMSTQLLGTGGVAVLLLIGAGTRTAAAADVALTLALIGAFVTFAFVGSLPGPPSDEGVGDERE